MIDGLKGRLRRMGLIDRKGMKAFLRDVSGVIHVGAHTGQERKLYAQYRLDVLWIEALDEQFETLKRNLAGYPSQRALRCLLTDQDHQEYQFHIASNAGASSSILELGLHEDIWPGVTYTKSTTITSSTLPTLLKEQGIDPSGYDALVMDTQGSELLVLKGALALLRNFKYIQTEVADFEAYRGCCQLADIEAYLAQSGYEECARKMLAQHPNGGRYFDIVFMRD
jgi:FkbM family methyltransferase